MLLPEVQCNVNHHCFQNTMHHVTCGNDTTSKETALEFTENHDLVLNKGWYGLLHVHVPIRLCSNGFNCFRAQKFGFIDGVNNVNWPPYRDSKS